MFTTGRIGLLIERGVRMPMSDGTVLVADVWRPEVSEPVATVLHRTPYDRTATPLGGASTDALSLVLDGFAVVVQDIRGCFGSEGSFDAFVNEPSDGADTVDWINRQPWSNGRTGMIGRSYHGLTQWAAAVRRPPGLATIIPAFSPVDYYADWVFPGGVFAYGFNVYSAIYYGADHARQSGAASDAAELTRMLDQMDRWWSSDDWRANPLIERWAPYVANDWLAHPEPDAWWEGVSPSAALSNVDIPVFSIGGWYDIFLRGTVEGYREMRSHSASARSRSAQQLVIGPWAHANMSGEFSDRAYGTESSIGSADLGGMQRRWLGHWLRDEPVSDSPRASVFVMGLDEWRTFSDWPPVESTRRPWKLVGPGGGATSVGSITPGAGLSTERVVNVPVDLNDLVPTWGGRLLLPGAGRGRIAGPIIQPSAGSRSDVRTFVSEPIEHRLDLAGEIVASLRISNAGPATPALVRISDVSARGVAMNIGEGIQLIPGTESQTAAITVPIDLGHIAYRFGRGHRIRLDVMGSSHPAIQSPSLGSLGFRILTGGESGSTLELPVLEAGFD